MAHFAELDENNVVKRVIVLNNADIVDENGVEQEHIGIALCKSIFGGTWKQTSYNSNIRKRYAGVGYSYNEALDAFIPPKMFASWVLDNAKADWVAPTPIPTDGVYRWDELTTSWLAVPKPFPSWYAQGNPAAWVPPTPPPSNYSPLTHNNCYVWDEQSKNWITLNEKIPDEFAP